MWPRKPHAGLHLVKKVSPTVCCQFLSSFPRVSTPVSHTSFITAVTLTFTFAAFSEPFQSG